MYSLAYFVRDHTAKLFGSCGRDQHGVQTLKIDAWQKCSLHIRACGGEVRPASKCRKKWQDLSSLAKKYNLARAGHNVTGTALTLTFNQSIGPLKQSVQLYYDLNFRV